jgi:hypothetical protein
MQTKSFNAENAEKRFEEKLMITNQVIEGTFMLEINIELLLYNNNYLKIHPESQ